MNGDRWPIIVGDCVEVMAGMEPDSVGWRGRPSCGMMGKVKLSCPDDLLILGRRILRTE